MTKSLNVHVDMMNPDGTDVFNVMISQADYDSYSASQTSPSN